MNLWQWQMHGSLVFCYTQLVMKVSPADVQFGTVFIEIWSHLENYVLL